MWSARLICLVKFFITCLHAGVYVTVMWMIFHDPEVAREGLYRCMPGWIWVHVRANLGSRGCTIMGLESGKSRAVSAWVRKHSATIFSKTYNNVVFYTFLIKQTIVFTVFQ